MTDGEGDGDRILDLVGVGLVVLLVAGLGVVVLAGMSGSGGGEQFRPEANWSVDRVNDTHVRIVHEGGDAVQADDLIVVVGKVDRGIRRQKILQKGEGLVVAVPRNESVVLYWKAGEAKRRVTLARWDRI